MSSKKTTQSAWTFASAGVDALWGQKAAIALPPIGTPGQTC